MALSGLEIYKHLPKTNCKKCGFPTCLAFAMKLAQKGVELSACPDISEQAKEALAAAAKPPIRLVTIGQGEAAHSVGNEVVLFRHEKTFYHPPALLVRVRDSEGTDAIAQRVAEVRGYEVERVGTALRPTGLAVENASGDAEAFSRCVSYVASQASLPLVLMSPDPAALGKALAEVASLRPLLYATTKENVAAMVALAKQHGCPLAVRSRDGPGELAELAQQVAQAGIEDIVLDHGARDFAGVLALNTQLRRLALKKNFRALGFPIIGFPGEGAETAEEECLLAAQMICKYSDIIVLDHFWPTSLYPLLTLRQNIFTDPQKPIQVEPGLYKIREPGEQSPVLVTTNFSLTYFSVAGEVEGSNVPSWLVIADAEGLSVLTAWAAGKFDAEKIAKSVKGFGVAEKVRHREIVIPGHVAGLSGELEDELPGWRVRVGPKEAVDLPGYLKQMVTSLAAVS